MEWNSVDIGKISYSFEPFNRLHRRLHGGQSLLQLQQLQICERQGASDCGKGLRGFLCGQSG